MKKENMIFRLKMEIASLVNEMVAKLPDELFLSDSTTFLDPSMGGGQYVSAIEQRLRKWGHSDDNIKSRVFGVEKNMLRVNYAIKKNKLVGTYSVDKNDIPSILICNMKFDCIVGNPPYQETTKEGTSIAGGGKKLWTVFVQNSINSLKDGGYLSIVHPSGWRSLMNPLWKEIYQKYQISNVVLEPKVNWTAGVKVDHYLLQKIQYTVETSVTFDGKTRFMNFIKINGIVPFPLVEKILNWDGDKLCFNRKQTHHISNGTKNGFISDNKTKKYCYPIKHTGASDIKWSSKKHEWQDLKKVLTSYTGYLLPVYDDGEFGTSEHCHAIFVSSKEEASYIINLLKSKLYKFAQSNTKTSGFNDLKILNSLPYPKNLPINFKDSDLYAYFQLTDEEIKLVETTIKR